MKDSALLVAHAWFCMSNQQGGILHQEGPIDASNVCLLYTSNVQYYDVILKPVVTEKSMNAMAEKKYTFLVHPDANKTMIKEAVERMFEGTKVAKVNTMNCEGKNRRRGMVTGKTAKTKKAIVQLTEDSKDIEIFAGL